MKFVNETMQAVVFLVCDKHAEIVLDRLSHCTEGNWFMLPSISACRMGYRSNLSDAHAGHGCAIFGFAERSALAGILPRFAAVNPDGSLCPDCVAYEWDVTPSMIARQAKDPVCGRMVDTENGFAAQRMGELFLFCSVGCRDTFQKAPERYAAPHRETQTV